MILANQKEQLIGRIALPVYARRVDRVRWSTALDFQGVQRETRFVFDRQPDHTEPMRCTACRVVGFERRLGRRNEDYLLELELLKGLASEDQVAMVNRIEGTAVKS